MALHLDGFLLANISALCFIVIACDCCGLMKPCNKVTLVYDIIDSSSLGTKTDIQFATVDSVQSSILLYLHFLMNTRTFTRAKA